nr:hypothetical protein [Tanacetum cinerariifolium]
VILSSIRQAISLYASYNVFYSANTCALESAAGAAGKGYMKIEKEDLAVIEASGTVCTIILISLVVLLQCLKCLWMVLLSMKMALLQQRLRWEKILCHF